MCKFFIHLSCLTLFLLVLSCSSPFKEHSSQFTPLFNGTNLDGWTTVNGDKSTWVAKDGMIVTTGKPTGVLRTNNMYENFILELDWKHAVSNGNAGLFVWSDPLPAQGVPFTRSIEVQIMDGKELDWYTTHGDIFSIWGASMVPDDKHPMGYHIERCLPSERRSKPAPEWNHYVVTCIDGQINLSVNGAFVSGATQVTPRKGYICLEAEGTEAHFKNIQILELPPTAPALPKEMVALEDTGFKTVFTGIDLSGWDAKNARGWTVNDNILRCDGDSTTLTTTTSTDLFQFMFDFKCEDESSEIYIVIDEKKSDFACDVKEWRRVVVQGARRTIGIGGKNVAFTNLFVKPLD